VTDRFGIVTAEFGNVTDHFGDVTDRVFLVGIQSTRRAIAPVPQP
jgi:hypothetical protein